MSLWKPVPGLKIAIDGPSGSGKGTIAAMLAEKIHLPVLDTGLLYRLVAAVALERGLALDDIDALCRLVDELLDQLHWSAEGIEFAGRIWSDELRDEQVGDAASRVAALADVRQKLLNLQRRLAESGCIMDGRDIGTVVLPDAPAKFFLTASRRERARRRWSQLRAMGRDVELDETVQELKMRDQRDMERQHAPLRKAEDAIVIDSTTMRPDEVVDRMLAILERRGLVRSE